MAEYIDKWYGDGVKDERNKWITKIEKRIEELKSFPAYKKGFDKNLFGYDDIISELKSLLESENGRNVSYNLDMKTEKQKSEIRKCRKDEINASSENSKGKENEKDEN